MLKLSAFPGKQTRELHSTIVAVRQLWIVSMMLVYPVRDDHYICSPDYLLMHFKEKMNKPDKKTYMHYIIDGM